MTDRHYHVLSNAREIIALDAASVDDAIHDTTEQDPDAAYTVAPCHNQACLAALDADEQTR